MMGFVVDFRGEEVYDWEPPLLKNGYDDCQAEFPLMVLVKLFGQLVCSGILLA